MTRHTAHKKSAARVKKGQRYQCAICGYRIIVDQVCGCAEEHVFICCDQPMKKAPAKKKPAAKKAAKKK
jgi:hypothetical protein